jgi:DNA-binding transcriptional LysR family regulator
MARPSLLNLETAIWAGRLGSFSAVARKMNATQPAVSLRIRELEVSLRAKLFERRGRRMEPTIEGRAFLQRIEPLLQELQGSLASFEGTAEESGVIRIGSGDIPMNWTGDLIHHLQKLLPRVSCELQIGIAGKLLSQLEDGKLDVVIIAGPVEHPELESLSLGRTAMLWVMGSDRWHRYGKGQEDPSMAQLLNNGPIWLIPRTSRYFAHQAAELQQQGAQLRNVSTCDNMSTLIQLVVSGSGIGYLPEVLIADHVKRGRLLPLFPKRPAGYVEYVLVTQRGRKTSVVDKLIDLAGKHPAFT